MSRRTGRALSAASVIVLLALLHGSAWGEVNLPPETDKWTEIQTAHFLIYSNASQRRSLDLGRRLERFRGALSRFNTKFKVDPPVTTSIYVFKDDASMTPYKARFNGRPIEMAGLFIGQPDGYDIVLNGERQGDPLEIVYHEYTHHFLGNNLHDIPTWFGEGLAECYGKFRADDTTASIGLAQEDHVRLLRQHDLMPLRDLFAVTKDSEEYNEGERRGVFYAESWALMHYLLWDKPERRPQFVRFLARLDHGEDPDTAFPMSFETSYQVIENELQNYVRQGRFVYTVLKLSDLAIDETIRVAPMKRETILARLGDLLVHLDRAAEAEAYYREALRLAPEDPVASAGLANVECLTGRYDEATALFEKAIALDPGHPIACLHFGQCLARRTTSDTSSGSGSVAGADLDRAGDMFGKAIQLRPDFAEAYVEYARLLMKQGGEPGSAIHLLEVARPLLRSRTDIVANLAILHARKGDIDAALDLVDNVLARMNDREALEQARSAIRAQQDYREALKSEASREASARQEAVDMTEPVTDEPPPLPAPVPPPQVGGGGASESVADYNKQVEAYNQAVARANLGDLKGAIALLDALVKQVHNQDLRAQITTLLGKLEADLDRLSKSRP